jgi:hypothetical protein
VSVIRRLASVSGVVLLALLLTSRVGPAQTALVPPGAEELAAHTVALTAPEMEGRGSGTPGGALAARYIEERLAAAGLRPGGDAGGWRQSFVLRPGTRLGPGNALGRTGAAPLALEVSRDWTPHGGAPSSDVEAELVFVGAGGGGTGDRMGDSMDEAVRGKIALVLEGGATRLERLIAARRAGAVALLLVSDNLLALERTAVSAGLPSATVTPAAADLLLAPAGMTVAALARTPAAPGSPAPVVATGVTARLAIRLEPADRRADNVIGILPGTDPARAGESVVIGAHYDHLGRIGGAIYHGADDNASGTAVVLGLAKAFAAAGGAPRTLVFVLFSGEEMGLIGSGHYVRHPVLPLERAAAMVNFDMVGRMREGRVTVAGVESGDALRALVTAAAAGEPLAVAYRESPFAPSDQARFYAAGVPVLFFTTGGHPDYHKPTDTADLLDTAGMARIAAVGLRVVAGLAASPRPVFVKVAPPAGGRTREASGARPAAGAFLGVSVDGEGSEGLRIGAIVPDSGAERGGLRPGDVVIRIDDSGIGGFEDLVAMLGRRRPGETARVVYLRDGEAYTVPVTLGERP